MSEIDIDQLMADMEAGTKGPWLASALQGPRRQTNFARVFAADDDLRYVADCCDSLNFHSKTDNEVNARRIARLPDLEKAYLELRKENEGLREALGRIEISTDTKEQGRIATAALMDIFLPEGTDT